MGITLSFENAQHMRDELNDMGWYSTTQLRNMFSQDTAVDPLPDAQTADEQCDALDTVFEKCDKSQVADVTVEPVVDAVTPPAADVTVATVADVTVEPAADAVTPPAADVAASRLTTRSDLRAACVAATKRLGGSKPVIAALSEFGSAVVDEIAEDKLQSAFDVVSGLKAE